MADVIIYTNPNCPVCEAAKALLNSLAVYFEERQASEFAKILRNKGFCSVPIIQVDNQYFCADTLELVILVLRKFKLMPGDR